MSINLVKGQKIDLTKGNNNIKKLAIGLGWDAGDNIDCDASVIVLGLEGKLKEIIYFRNKTNDNKSIVHSGDNLTGEGEGDDEVIIVDIPKLDDSISKLIFVVNIYDCEGRKQDFGMIKNAYIRIVNDSEKSELAKYNLSENYAGSTALVAGEIYRHNGEWKFNAIGNGTKDKGIRAMADLYR